MKRTSLIDWVLALLYVAVLGGIFWALSGRLPSDSFAFVGAWLLEWFPNLWLFSVMMIHSTPDADAMAQRERYAPYFASPRRLLPIVQGFWIGYSANHPILVAGCYSLALLLVWVAFARLFRRNFAEIGDPPHEFTLTRFTFGLGMELSGVVAMLLVKRLLHLPVRAF